MAITSLEWIYRLHGSIIPTSRGGRPATGGRHGGKGRPSSVRLFDVNNLHRSTYSPRTDRLLGFWLCTCDESLSRARRRAERAHFTSHQVVLSSAQEDRARHSADALLSPSLRTPRSVSEFLPGEASMRESTRPLAYYRSCASQEEIAQIPSTLYSAPQ